MKKLILLISLSVCAAFAQNGLPSAPAWSISSGPGTPSSAGKVCSDYPNVGSLYTQTQNPTGGFSGLWVCEQTGATPGGFAWIAVPNQGSSPVTGNALIGAGTSCGSSASCASPTAITAPLKIVTGTQAMSAGTSVAITGMPAFTSATSYSCSVSNADGHAYTSGAEIISATAVTLVSGTSNSDTWIYLCIGT